MQLFQRFLLAFLLAASLAACDSGSPDARSAATPADVAANSQAAPARVERFSYEVINKYPHDPRAYTQGLVYQQGIFYESAGLYGESSLRRVELATGRVLQKVDVPGQYFAEGLALFNGRLFQLTWQEKKTFVYDANSFSQLATFNYTGEGWGLTHDGRSLIMSDGTSRIRFLDPGNFTEQRSIEVNEGGYPINQLNELEYVKGQILANIYQTDRIARIDPQTGRVTAWINLTGLLTPEDRGDRQVDVLNGIAYDEAGDRLFVTGKWWPKLYEIKLVQRRNNASRSE